MDVELRERLNLLSLSLHKRALELSRPGQDEDTGTMMSSMAVIMETLAIMGEELKTPRSGPSEEL
jgi:hypothetical protein